MSLAIVPPAPKPAPEPLPKGSRCWRDYSPEEEVEHWAAIIALCAAASAQWRELALRIVQADMTLEEAQRAVLASFGGDSQTKVLH